jgi:hypothetical protein
MKKTHLILNPELFAEQTIDLLKETEILDDYERPVGGKIGVDYLACLLLDKRRSSPRLDHIRSIASRLTQDDANSTDTYPDCIRALCSLIEHHGGSIPMRSWKPTVGTDLGDVGYESDLLAAAAYTGKLAIVQAIVENISQAKIEMIRIEGRRRLLGNPYAAAAMGGDRATILYLLQKIDENHKSYALDIMVRDHVWTRVCHFCSLETTQQLLASNLYPFTRLRTGWLLCIRFRKVSATHDIEKFHVIERFMVPNTGWCDQELADVLLVAAEQGWDEMAGYLLDKGVPTHGNFYWPRVEPLQMACHVGSEGVVKKLLQHHALVFELHISIAAQRGLLGMVKMLVEHGVTASDQTGASPIISAIRLEHKDMFRMLLKHGVKFAEEDKVHAIGVAKEDGLDSMVEFLEGHVVVDQSEL